MHPRATVALAALAIGTTSGGAARAETCGSVDDFHAATVARAASSVRVTYDVTGVNPADYAGTKGALVHFQDTRCAAGAEANLKLYGPDDPPNAAHPAGTLKYELGNPCCPAPPCQVETWAEPNPSEVVFVDGTEQCAVEVSVDPATIAYRVDCGGGPFLGVGDNVDRLEVTAMAILRRVDGGWAMPNAVATDVAVCWELAPAAPGAATLELVAIEDATTSASAPDAVVVPTTDLVVEAGESDVWLKFDASALPGRAEKATLRLHRSDVASAAGDGGDAFAVADLAWSEATLTWSSRPAVAGAALARVAPVADFAWYAWDVTEAVKSPGPLAFAIRPRPTDGDGAHFFSKEAPGDFAPRLVVEYVVVDADGDGAADGPDCDDSNPSRHPGAAESCNGVDDDCDGSVDEGCPAGAGGAGQGGAPAAGGGRPGAGGAGPGAVGQGVSEDAEGATEGCGCEAPGRAPRGVAGVVVAAGLAIAAWRRRPAAHRLRASPRRR